jgi:hypothetical protein
VQVIERCYRLFLSGSCVPEQVLFFVIIHGLHLE